MLALFEANLAATAVPNRARARSIPARAPSVCVPGLSPAPGLWRFAPPESSGILSIVNQVAGAILTVDGVAALARSVGIGGRPVVGGGQHLAP